MVFLCKYVTSLKRHFEKLAQIPRIEYVSVMSFEKRVNLQIYIAGFLLCLIAGGYFWYQSGQNMTWFAILMMAIGLNQYMLVQGLSSIVKTLKSSEKPSAAKILSFLLGKTIILGAAIYMVLRFAQENIYIALGLYIFQLINVFISFKTNA